MGSLGVALVAPAGRLLVVEAAVMMWMNNSMDFYKTFFFRNFANRIITVGSLGAALVAPCRGSYVNYNTFCMLRRCRCVNNRISVANLCKLQYFLYVASLPLFSKGF